MGLKIITVLLKIFWHEGPIDYIITYKHVFYDQNYGSSYNYQCEYDLLQAAIKQNTFH